MASHLLGNDTGMFCLSTFRFPSVSGEHFCLTISMALPFALTALAAQHYSDHDEHSESETVSTTSRGNEFSGSVFAITPLCTIWDS